MTNIINPFAGYKVAATWAWHLAHKKLTPIPGTDYKVTPGDPVHAAATGRATHTIGAQHQVSIAVDGGAITVRELGSVKGAFPRNVKQGDVIGYASLPKWPHIEFDRITADGTTYEPIENHITPTAEVESTGETTTPTGTEDEMILAHCTATSKDKSIGIGGYYKISLATGHIAHMADAQAIAVAQLVIDQHVELTGDQIIEAVKVGKA